MDYDTLFRETVVAHVPGAQVHDGVVDLGIAGLHMRCHVNGVKAYGSLNVASLFFLLWGGPLGSSPVFASVAGYDNSPERAIVAGACDWAHTFGPVLRAAFTGDAPTDVDHFEVELSGQSFRVFVDGFDRVLGQTSSEAVAAARARLAPERYLTRTALASGRMPLLDAERPTIVSVFISDGQLVEVKVDGRDWPNMDDVFARPGAGAPMVLLRELAVLVPHGPTPPVPRKPLELTLRGLATPTTDGGQRRCVDWPGWRQHTGKLAPPLSASAIASLEAQIGELPADYRDFLVNVGASGAGPGYGLLSPLGDAQASLATGAFSWTDNSEPTEEPQGVLALAHAGCGLMWLLVLEGPYRGEVWIDSTSSDHRVRRVASSFTQWYRTWLSSCVRDAVPWIQWNGATCSTPAALSAFVAALEGKGLSEAQLHAEVAKQVNDGAMALASGGSSYFPSGAPLDPCHSCVSLMLRFGVSASVFARGQAPFTTT